YMRFYALEPPRELLFGGHPHGDAGRPRLTHGFGGCPLVAGLNPESRGALRLRPQGLDNAIPVVQIEHRLSASPPERAFLRGLPRQAPSGPARDRLPLSGWPPQDRKSFSDRLLSP